MSNVRCSAVALALAVFTAGCGLTSDGLPGESSSDPDPADLSTETQRPAVVTSAPEPNVSAPEGTEPDVGPGPEETTVGSASADAWYVSAAEVPADTTVVGLCRWARYQPTSGPGDFQVDRIWLSLETGELIGYHQPMVAPLNAPCSPAHTYEGVSYDSTYSMMLVATSRPNEYVGSTQVPAEEHAVYLIDAVGKTWRRVVELPPVPDFGDDPPEPRITFFSGSDDLFVWEEEDHNGFCDVYQAMLPPVGAEITREQMPGLQVKSKVRCGDDVLDLLPEPVDLPQIPDSPVYEFTLAGFEPAIAALNDGGYYFTGYSPDEYVLFRWAGPGTTPEKVTVIPPLPVENLYNLGGWEPIGEATVGQLEQANSR